MEVVIDRRVRRRRRLVRLFFRLLLICLVLAAGAAVSLLSYTKMQGPPPLNVSQTTVFYGADNSPIGQHHQGENRHWVGLSSIDNDIINATISIEDRRFYNHLGFDLTRIGGAVVANLRSRSMAQGASTLTQQYARNLYLSHDKTWVRKWNELLYSLRLEMNYDKDQILEGYLNTVYYGHGAYGVEAASHHYFGKSANDLTLAEASMLSGIPKGPSYYSPLIDFDRAKRRQAVVLQSMVDNGVLTQVEADEAHAEPLNFIHDELDNTSTVGPYFQAAVEKILIQDVGIDPALLEAGGLKVYTTLDPDMQKEAEYWVRREMPDSELQTALVAMDPQTGDVKALVGGKNYVESPFNRAIDARRHPGSSFKPFLYYAALENGFTPASTLMSEETTFEINGGQPWSPSNFNDNYAEDFITLLQAMAFSDNIYAVKTHLYLGTDKAGELAHRVGIESPLGEGAALALGASDVGIAEMARAYSAFANGGKKVEPRFIKKVVDREGEVLYESEPHLEQVLDPKLAFIITDLMKGMFDPYLNAHTSVTGRSVSHLINRPVAGKSGSTSRDSWMVGYTPQLVTSVWVGYDSGTNLNQATDGQYAKKIWANFTEHALNDQEAVDFPIPDGVVGVEMNPLNGLLATEDCPTHRVTYFVEGTEPTKECPKPASDGEEVEAIDEESHEKERFIDRFFRWFGH
ncbi:transglycosylase domain-containing protein [Halalkalibacter flavus]|uniref:transglycosylase domain-containing protein n=1 Tax=Halalkalibacter flavus TaxID=3090668 RepID=UPI002FCB8C15